MKTFLFLLLLPSFFLRLEALQCAYCHETRLNGEVYIPHSHITVPCDNPKRITCTPLEDVCFEGSFNFTLLEYDNYRWELTLSGCYVKDLEDKFCDLKKSGMEVMLKEKGHTAVDHRNWTCHFNYCDDTDVCNTKKGVYFHDETDGCKTVTNKGQSVGLSFLLIGTVFTLHSLHGHSS